MGYTMRVQHIVEMFNCDTEHAGFLSVNKKIKNACPKIFNFEIDIYDPDYLLPLETKIIRHYYMRDICCETVGLWQLYLNQFSTKTWKNITRCIKILPTNLIRWVTTIYAGNTHYQNVAMLPINSGTPAMLKILTNFHRPRKMDCRI